MSLTNVFDEISELPQQHQSCLGGLLLPQNKTFIFSLKSRLQADWMKALGISEWNIYLWLHLPLVGNIQLTQLGKQIQSISHHMVHRGIVSSLYQEFSSFLLVFLQSNFLLFRSYKWLTWFPQASFLIHHAQHASHRHLDMCRALGILQCWGKVFLLPGRNIWNSFWKSPIQTRDDCLVLVQFD